MITHEQVRKILESSNISFKKWTILVPYFMQQEKKDELLGLYQHKDKCMSRECLTKYLTQIQALETSLKGESE